MEGEIGRICALHGDIAELDIVGEKAYAACEGLEAGDWAIIRDAKAKKMSFGLGPKCLKKSPTSDS